MEKYTQLMIDPETGDVCEGATYITEDTPVKTENKKCKHNVKIKAFSKEFVSYCSKCGKFLSVRQRKSSTKEGTQNDSN